MRRLARPAPPAPGRPSESHRMPLEPARGPGPFLSFLWRLFFLDFILDIPKTDVQTTPCGVPPPSGERAPFSLRLLNSALLGTRHPRQGRNVATGTAVGAWLEVTARRRGRSSPRWQRVTDS